MRRLLVALFLLASTTYAHDAWFEPVVTNGVAELRLQLGERLVPEETLPFESARIAQIWIATGNGVRDLRDDRMAMVGLVKATGMIAVERIPFDVSLDPERFNSYLEDEGHFEAVQNRMRDGEYAKPVRERVTRHLKTFIGALDDSFLHGFGTRLEIVPLASPKVGEPLSVRVIFDGRPFANARVAVFEKTWQRMIRTDRNGEARVLLSTPGFVLVRTTHIERCSGCSVDYQSDWAALTFDVQ
ncbi:MAG TPA: DUF4198 domain-containing protein [Thermoanaerobaculia bacterium]|nr:DUF4198 domain-containing protein [Thermoanaerobaculia bacterium]